MCIHLMQTFWKWKGKWQEMTIHHHHLPRSQTQNTYLEVIWLFVLRGTHNIMAPIIYSKNKSEDCGSGGGNSKPSGLQSRLSYHWQSIMTTSEGGGGDEVRLYYLK